MKKEFPIQANEMEREIQIQALNVGQNNNGQSISH